jgi:hypothetical protein
MRVAVCIVALASTALAAQKPIEIDRTLQRVYEATIMASDVRQVRMLRLVTPAPDSDQAAQTALENRLLMLREAARGAIAEPAADQIAARRQAWTAAWPAGTDLPALLQRAGMNDRALDGWFRDDLRIEAYLDQRFSQPDPKRDERIAAWIRDLRARASLPVRLGPA